MISISLSVQLRGKIKCLFFFTICMSYTGRIKLCCNEKTEGCINKFPLGMKQSYTINFLLSVIVYKAQCHPGKEKREDTLSMLKSYKYFHSLEKVDAHIRRAKNIIYVLVCLFLSQAE